MTIVPTKFESVDHCDFELHTDAYAVPRIFARNLKSPLQSRSDPEKVFTPPAYEKRRTLKLAKLNSKPQMWGMERSSS